MRFAAFSVCTHTQHMASATHECERLASLVALALDFAALFSRVSPFVTHDLDGGPGEARRHVCCDTQSVRGKSGEMSSSR